MASTGPNTAPPHSSFICPSFTRSHLNNLFFQHLSVNCPSAFINCDAPVLSPSPLFILSLIPIHCTSICTLVFFAVPSHSLFPGRPPSRVHFPSRCRATSVALISYSRNIWTALMGTNHKYFEVLQGSPEQNQGTKSLPPMPPVSCGISFSYFSL